MYEYVFSSLEYKYQAVKSKPSRQILDVQYVRTSPGHPQDVPRTSPSNVPRTSPKGPIWPSRGRPDLTSLGRPKMASRGRPNLTYKERPREVDSGRPQDVLRTFPRGPSKHPHLDVPKFLLSFLLELIRLTKSI